MTLPQTYIATLLLTILSMLCWGSWANTFKMAGNWRFELFYFDYSLGVLLAAISVAGLAVAFPVGIGMALVIGVVWNYFIKPQGNPVLLFGGAAIIVCAIIMDSFAYKSHAAAQLELQAKAGLLKTSAPRVSPKGIVLSLVSGVLMGSFFPLVEMGKAYGSGLGPYAIGFVFDLC